MNIKEFSTKQSHYYEKENKRKNYFKFSAIEIFYFTSIPMGVYLTVFMQNIGLTSTEIGGITSIATIVSALSLIFWATLSDKIRSVRKIFLICITISIIILLLFPWLGNMKIGLFPIVFVMIPILGIFRYPSNTLLDSWQVSNSSFYKHNYSTIRLWGSVGFVLMSFFLSFISRLIDTSSLFYIFGILLIPVIAIGLKTREVKTGGEKKLSFKELKVGRLFKNYYYVTYMFFMIGLTIYFSITVIFTPFILQAVGENNSLAGLITGFRSVFEIILLFLIKYLKKRFSFPVLLIISALFTVAEHLLYSVAGNLTQLMLIMAVSGIASGLFFGSSPRYIFSIVPPELNTTAQSLSAMIMLIVGIFGTFFGGMLIENLGIRTVMFGCGILALGICIIFVISQVIGKKVFNLVPQET